MTSEKRLVRRPLLSTDPDAFVNASVVTQEMQYHRRTIAVSMASLLVAFWASIGATSLGTNFFLLRQFFGVALLTIAPGFLILLFFDHPIDRPGEMILYIVGFSLVFLAAISIVISILYPVFGITNPLSFLPLSLTVSGIILGLTILVYQQDRSFLLRIPSLTQRDTKIATFLLCLPVVAALAAHRMNTLGSNRLMYVFLFLVVIAVLVSSELSLRSSTHLQCSVSRRRSFSIAT